VNNKVDVDGAVSKFDAIAILIEYARRGEGPDVAVDRLRVAVHQLSDLANAERAFDCH